MLTLVLGGLCASAFDVSRWGAAAAPVAVDSVVKATVVLLLAWAATRLTGRASAAARHWVWLLGLASLPALPVLTLLLPAWRIMPAWARGPRPQEAAEVKASRRTAASLPPYVHRGLSTMAGTWRGSESPSDLVHRPAPSPIPPVSSGAVAPEAIATAAAPSRADASGSAQVRPTAAAPPIVPVIRREAAAPPPSAAALPSRVPDVYGWALIVWAAGAACALAPALAGLVSLALLRRRASTVADPAVTETARRAAADLGLRRRVLLLELPGALPMTWGVFRSKVLLPAEAAAWPREQLEAVLIHELGHVRRLDCLAEWVARLVCSVYWFHPLAWLAARRLAREREIACDDLVLSRGHEAESYADHLLQIVAAVGRGGAVRIAAIPMGRRSGLEARLHRILDGRGGRRPPTWRFVVLLTAAAAAVVLPLAMSRAQVGRTAESPKPVGAAPPATQPAAPPASHPAAQPTTAPTAASVPVRVVDESGKPVARARVRLECLYPHGQGTNYYDQALPDDVTTAADGAATFTVTPAAAADVAHGAMWQLVALADGHAPARANRSKKDGDGPLEIRLTPGQSISGVVRRPGGAPLARAAVRIFYHEVVVQHPIEFLPDFAATASTDGEGRFRIEYVMPGVYMLTAADESASPPLCTDAVRVELPPDRRALPPELDAKPAVVIRGRIVSAHPVPVDGLPLSVSLRAPVQRSWGVKVEPDGSFTATGIGPGTDGSLSPWQHRPYITEAEWPDAPAGSRVGPLSSAHFSNLAPGVYRGLLFHLCEPAKLKAVVVDTEGKPFVQVGVVPEPASNVYFTDAEGRVTVNVPPNVDVTLKFQKGRVLASEEAVGPLRLKEGETVERRYVVRRAEPLPPHDHVLAGRVVDADGKPVPGALVELGNQSILPREVTFEIGNQDGKPKPTWTQGIFFPARVTSDAQGKFRFDMLLDRRSDVWARGPGKNADAWVWARDVGVDVAGLTLTLRPAPGGAGAAGAVPTFSGPVFDAAGRPVAGAKVTLFDGQYPNKTPPLGEATSDAAGHYEVRPASPPSRAYNFVRLVCRAPDGRVIWRMAPACGGDDVRLTYQPAASLSGRVVSKRGEPLGGARVWLYEARDPVGGGILFGEALDPFAPEVRSKPDGTFTLGGLPAGGQASVKAKHPQTAEGGCWYVPLKAGDNAAGDIVVKDGISVEGVVRDGGTGRPVGGAEVRAVLYHRIVLGTAKSKANGVYRLEGLSSSIAEAEVEAAAAGANGVPEYEGAVRFMG